MRPITGYAVSGVKRKIFEVIIEIAEELHIYPLNCSTMDSSKYVDSRFLYIVYQSLSIFLYQLRMQEAIKDLEDYEKYPDR